MRKKTLQQTQSLIQSANAWELWRILPPSDFFGSSLLLEAIRARLTSALTRYKAVCPTIAEEIDGILGDEPQQLFRLLKKLPANLQAEEFDAYDVRMTAAFRSGFGDHWDGRTLFNANVLAPDFLARGLIAYADIGPRPGPVRRSKPRRLWTPAEREEVSSWKRDRRRLFAIAKDWMRCGTIKQGRATAEVQRNDSAFFEEANLLLSRAYMGADKAPGSGQAQARARMGRRSTSFQSEPDVLTDGCKRVLKQGTKFSRQLEKEGWDRLTKPLPLRGSTSPDAITDLSREFPWMTDAIDRLRFDFNLSRVSNSHAAGLKVRPMLLVGPAGTGKTRFVRRLAELVDVPLRTVNCGGSADNRDLAGSASVYSDAEPSAVLRAMRDTGCANPLFLVDEVEKASRSRRNGRVIDTLLSMLEPETSRQWFDECLCVPADLTAVNWILTANDIDGLPEPLMSRLTIVRVPIPAGEHLPSILDNLKREIAQEFGVDVFALPDLLPEVEDALSKAFAGGASIRRIRSALVSAIGASLELPQIRH